MTVYPELQTIRDYLRWAVSRFTEANLHYGHGTDSAWDEAIALILHSLHLPHDIDRSILDANLTAEEKAKLQRLIDRRILERIPVPYLTHEAWFGRLPFFVDERVLIPRSALAELIENELQPWVSDSGSIHQILDLCTGSGCIGILCAKTFPDSKIDASDISTEALTVAKINTIRHEVADQVNLIQSDLFDQLPNKKYDLIISNPPYVNQAEMDSLPPEYHHEPKLGLEAGKDGLNIARIILKKASLFLKPEGLLIVEVGNTEEAIIEAFPEIPFTWLEFERGDGGVFLLTKEQLKN